MLAFAEQLRSKTAGLRVLNLGGGDVDDHTPMGSMVFTVMAARRQGLDVQSASLVGGGQLFSRLRWRWRVTRWRR
jgi:hypothetical protein